MTVPSYGYFPGSGSLLRGPVETAQVSPKVTVVAIAEIVVENFAELSVC